MTPLAFDISKPYNNKEVYGDAVALMGGSRSYFVPLLDDSRV